MAVSKWRWRVKDEQDLDGHGRGSIQRVEVELPDGTTFEQHVMKLPEAVVVAAVNASDEVLLLRRHRFIVDRMVWELPGGYIDEGEQPEAAAKRELLEETGFEAATVEHLVSFQPMAGSADAVNHVYLAVTPRESEAERDVNEAGETAWVPLAEVPALVKSGEIVGAGSVVALAELRIRAVERRQAAKTG